MRFFHQFCLVDVTRTQLVLYFAADRFDEFHNTLRILTNHVENVVEIILEEGTSKENEHLHIYMYKDNMV